MKKLLCCACTALLSIAAVSPCFAADSPWNGTWKENLAKGKRTGATIIITAKGSGYHFSNGSTIEYDFACDGKPVTTAGTGTIACTKAPDGFDFVQTANGVVTSKQHRTFSADGKEMTMKTTVIDSDGTTSTTVLVRQRKTGTTGLVGEWMNAKSTSTEPSVETTTVTGDTIHFKFQHSDIVVDAKLDGSDTKVTGSRVSPGSTQAYKVVSPAKLAYTNKLNGKVMSEGTMTLSADGKSYTDESWLPGKASEKTVDVYEKQ